MNIGAPEVLVVFVVALLVFGPQRLPEVARQIAGAMRQLRQMQDSVKTELRTVLHEDPALTPAKPATPTPAVGPTATPASAADQPVPSGTAAEEPDHTDLPPAPPAGSRDGFVDPPESFL
jgi:Tat protein translocase TatB subunit